MVSGRLITDLVEYESGSRIWVHVVFVDDGEITIEVYPQYNFEPELRVDIFPFLHEDYQDHIRLICEAERDSIRRGA